MVTHRAVASAKAGFDQRAWLDRIGYCGPLLPTLETLHGLIVAHSSVIAYESLDILLGHPPSLDIGLLQKKMIFGQRGGYCFEQNMLFRAGLRSLGFDVTSLQARVVRGLEVTAPRPMLHMVLQVNLPEGSHLADVGFGNLAPTAALSMLPDIEQHTPHGSMRFVTMGEELVLQSWLGDHWEHIYRVVRLPRFDAEYEICNWYTGTHPQSPYRNNIIVALPGQNGARLTLFNTRLNIRVSSGKAEFRILRDEDEFRDVFSTLFGLALTEDDLRQALAAMRERGATGAPHPFFA